MIQFNVIILSLLLSGCLGGFYSSGKSYKVNNKKYYVLKSSKGYKKYGYASWYGRGFHSKKTASGERFNMYALTAAHKTLPLNSRVKITNVKNGRSVVVKINDRGPFVFNRDIDLSYAAAQKIGILPNGSAYVKIESIS
jgi:rare lipoprotein A